MPVIALGYLGFGVKDIATWRHYASAILGVQVVETAEGGLKMRADTRDWRIAIEPSGEDDLIFAGWEVSGPQAFEDMIGRIEAAGTDVARDDGALAHKRNVMAVASFADPSGIRGEIFWGARDLPESPSSRPPGCAASSPANSASATSSSARRTWPQ